MCVQSVCKFGVQKIVQGYLDIWVWRESYAISLTFFLSLCLPPPSLSLFLYFIFLTLIILNARQDILKTILQEKIIFLNQFVCRPYPPPN